MQIENNNKAMEKIQLLDMKINNDKKMIKEEKHRHKALKKEILELQNKNWTENSGKDGKFKELEEKGEELKKKIELLEEESNKKGKIMIILAFDLVKIHLIFICYSLKFI